MGFEFLARTIALFNSTNQEEHFGVYGDNQGVIDGWKRGRSRNPRINEIFKRVTKLSRDTGIVIHTRYVRSARNPADGPSRGIYPPDSLLLPPINIPYELKPFISDYNDPANGRELPNGQPHPTTRTLPKPKPGTEGQANRRWEDDNFDSIARHLYKAKTTPQWN